MVCCDEVGGNRNGGVIFEQERKTFAELDDEARLELAREVEFDETDVGAGEATGRGGVGFGHHAEDARSAAEW